MIQMDVLRKGTTMMIKMGRRRLLALGAVGAALALGAGIGYAAIPDSGGVVHACYNSDRGNLKLIDPSGESAVDTTCNDREMGVDLLSPVPGTNKAFDSDTLDGLDSSALRTGFDAQTVTGTVTLSTTTSDIASVTVDAPANGWVILTGDGLFRAHHVNGTESFLRAFLTTTSGATPLGNVTLLDVPSSAPSGIYVSPFSNTRVFPVTAGSQTFFMTANVFSGAGAIIRPNLTAVFVSTQL